VADRSASEKDDDRPFSLDPRHPAVSIDASSPASAAARGDHRSEKSAMTKPKIMLVDDSPLILDVVGETLRGAGYDVITRSVAIGTGAAILRERPLLALLDVSMPLMTGAEISGSIRSSSMARMTWVVLHSDRPEAELKELVQRCGADGYIRKTGDSKQLLDAVHTWITRGRPNPKAGYILVACNPRTRERLARELQASLPIRFTDSGAEALRHVCSKDAPALVAVGTSLEDVGCEAIYRSAERTDPRWRSRFVVIEERGASTSPAGQLRALPTWSSGDSVVKLAAAFSSALSSG
jgi:DNA-binding response OmpR family regulator